MFNVINLVRYCKTKALVLVFSWKIYLNMCCSRVFFFMIVGRRKGDAVRCALKERQKARKEFVMWVVITWEYVLRKSMKHGRLEDSMEKGLLLKEGRLPGSVTIGEYMKSTVLLL